MTEDLIINACINGMIPVKSSNPHTPVTPEEIVAEVERVHGLGASIVHIHARAGDETPTWEPAYYQEIVSGIRERTPGIVVCVTTSGRLWNEPEKRAAALLLDGTAKPDMGSLTLGSLNFPKQVSSNPASTIQYLLDVMRERNIRPELEAFDLGMIDYAGYLVATGRMASPLYMNILLGNRGTADAHAANLDFMVSRLPADTTWAATGIGKTQFDVHRMALHRGGHVRVGIEDNLYLDHATKTPARNSDLIERVLAEARTLGRAPMPSAAVRERLGLPPAGV